MTDGELCQIRMALVASYLDEKNHDGILLSRHDNFSMATGGKRNYVGISTDLGACSIFVTRDGKGCFVGNTIESGRVLDEELAGLSLDAHTFKWFEGEPGDVVAREFGGNIVSDDGAIGSNVNAELAQLRALLTPLELDKYRVLGGLASDAMTSTLDRIEAGMSEWEIAAALTEEGMKRGCIVPVFLVAADERIALYRHPLPTLNSLMGGSNAARCVSRYAMVVGCFLREGLVASITRFKCVAEIEPELLSAYDRICGVDAIVQEATVPGRSLGDVFSACRKAYADLGFEGDEWHRHHQGGTTGYGARTCKGSPGETFPALDRSWAARVSERMGRDVEFGQAFAWNPSAPGVKSEDTFILNADGTREIVTATPGLPKVDLAGVLGRETEVVKSGMSL